MMFMAAAVVLGSDLARFADAMPVMFGMEARDHGVETGGISSWSSVSYVLNGLGRVSTRASQTTHTRNDALGAGGARSQVLAPC